MLLKHSSIYIGPDCYLYEASDLGNEHWVLWPVLINSNRNIKLYANGGFEVTLSGKVLDGLLTMFSVYDLEDTGIIDDAGIAKSLI